MIRQSRHSSRLLVAFIAVLLAAGAVGGAPSRAGSTQKGSDSSGSPSQATLDPQPPLNLAVEVVSVQKNRRGGVVSLLLQVSASVGIDEAVLSAKAPGNLVFADGSAVKTWNVDLAAPGAQSVPVEVIVPEDGKYVISAEIAGLTRGKPIHRGANARLLVGVRDQAPKVKDGAIEYEASPDPGAQP